jgi:hypothetical protein
MDLPYFRIPFENDASRHASGEKKKRPPLTFKRLKNKSPPLTFKRLKKKSPPLTFKRLEKKKAPVRRWPAF